jgi:hypothetical protein
MQQQVSGTKANWGSSAVRVRTAAVPIDTQRTVMQIDKMALKAAQRTSSFA